MGKPIHGNRAFCQLEALIENRYLYLLRVCESNIFYVSERKVEIYEIARNLEENNEI